MGRSMTEDKALLKNIMQDKDKWMYRATMLARVLEYLGYNPHNILNADKEVLSNGMLKPVEKMVKDFQV